MQCVVKPVILAIEPSDVNVSILVFFCFPLSDVQSVGEAADNATRDGRGHSSGL